MANSPATLLERMVDLLEDLGRKMSGGQPVASPTAQSSTSQPQQKGFTDHLADLFDDLLSAINRKWLGGSSTGSGPQWAPSWTTQSQTPPTTGPQPPQPPLPPRQPTYGVPPSYPVGGPEPVLETEASARRREWKQYGEHKTGTLQDELLGALPDRMESRTGQKVGSKAGEVVEVAQLGARAAAGDPTAMIVLVDKAAKQFEERLAKAGEAVSSFGRAMSTDSAGRAGGAALEGADQALQSMGIEDTPINHMLQFSKAVAESVDRLRDMSREMVNMNFRFAEVSASMAAAQAEQEFRDIELGIGKGEARADTTAELAEAMSEMNEVLAPLENAWANFSNEVMTNLVKLVTLWIKVDPVINSIKVMLEYLTKHDEDEDKGGMGIDFTTFLIEESKKFARPPRLPPGD